MTAGLRQQAVSGVAWNVAQKWLVRATTTIAFVVVGRQLGPEQFGLVALGMTFVGIMVLVSDLGFGSYLVQSEDVDQRTTSTAFWISSGIGLVLTTVLLLVAPTVEVLFATPGIATVLRWLSLTVLIAGIGSVPSALLQRRMQFKQLTFTTVTATVTSSGVAVVMALSGAGVAALVAQQVVYSVVSAVVLWNVARWHPTLEVDRALVRPMVGFGVKILGINVLGQVRDRVEELLIGAIAGVASLGVWSVAKRVIQMITDTCVSVIAGVATPTFARVKHDRDRLLRVFESSLAMSAAVIFPVLVTLAVVSRDLIPLVFGDQWAASAQLAQVLAFTALGSTLVYYDRSMFVALGRPGVELALVVTIIGVQVAVTVLAVQHGLLVLAWALAIRAFATIPLRYLVLHRVTGVDLGCYRRVSRVVVAVGLSGAAMVAAQAALPELPRLGAVSLQSAVGLGVYASAMWLLARELVREILRDARGLLHRGTRARAAQSPSPTTEPPVTPRPVETR